MRWLDRLFDRAIERRIRKSNRPLGGWIPRHVSCWTCEITHALPSNIRQALVSAEDFFLRHEGHLTNWHEHQGIAGLWTPNADIKTAYGSSAAYTITLTSLATASTLLAGRESTAVSNTSGLYVNYQIGGRITMGSVAATADKTIEVWAYHSINDTPTYPDVFDGTDSAETVTSVNIKRSTLKLIERLFVDTTTARVYWFGLNDLVQGSTNAPPKNHGLFVTQDSGQSLSATAGDHVLNYTPVFLTAI